MFGDLSGVDLALLLASILVSMSIHEMMHGVTAHFLGDTTAHEAGRLTLNPLRHIDVVTTVVLPMILILSHLPPIFAAKPVPFNPGRLKYEEFGTALVGVAGPLTNLLLAVLAALVFRGLHPDPASLFYNAIVIFTAVNIGFFIFNMIPFPPLDGSRLLYAFAPEPLQEIMERIEAAGFFVTLAFIFVAFQFIAGPIVNLQSDILNFLLS